MPLEHLAPLKFTLERLFGTKTWYELKESTSVTKWRKHLLRALSAIRIAFFETVKVRDDKLAQAVTENLARGEQALKAAKSLEDLLAAFSSTLTEQVFIQLGTVPRRRPGSDATLSPKFWQLDGFRSVQYVQTQEQLEALFWSEQQRELGVSSQLSLYAEYTASASELSYSQWCHGDEA
jgi:hypothetical protein